MPIERVKCSFKFIKFFVFFKWKEQEYNFDMGFRDNWWTWWIVWRNTLVLLGKLLLLSFNPNEKIRLLDWNVYFFFYTCSEQKNICPILGVGPDGRTGSAEAEAGGPAGQGGAPAQGAPGEDYRCQGGCLWNCPQGKVLSMDLYSL